MSTDARAAVNAELAKGEPDYREVMRLAAGDMETCKEVFALIRERQDKEEQA